MIEYAIYSASICCLDIFCSYFFTNRLIIWYIIHIYANIFVVSQCIPLMVTFFNDPIESFQNDKEYNIHVYAVIPHIYHCIAFKLSKDDIFHHFLFVFCGVIIKYYTKIGIFIAFYLFFIHGVPGAIDYFLLILCKTNKITKHKRHVVAVYLNSWFRCPGLIFSNTLCSCYILMNDERPFYKFIYIFLSMVMWSYNGLYYNYLVRDSYIVKYQQSIASHP